MAPHQEWQVSCRDIAGRRRNVTVTVKHNQVVLIAPPGEAAVLAPLEVGRLRALLREAAMSAALNAQQERR